jgi:hypothetical protein
MFIGIRQVINLNSEPSFRYAFAFQKQRPEVKSDVIRTFFDGENIRVSVYVRYISAQFFGQATPPQSSVTQVSM